MGAPANTASSKQQHRSFNSINQISSSVTNAGAMTAHLSLSGQKQRVGNNSIGQPLSVQKLTSQINANSVTGATHQMIDEVVIRLAQQSQPYSQYQPVPGSAHGSRNKASNLQQMNTVSGVPMGPSNIMISQEP
jgi:hypothetical protein